MSFSGIDILQLGTATAESKGIGALAIAWGDGAAAKSTNGIFNIAVAFGDRSEANVNNTVANEGFSASAVGNFNLAWAIGEGGKAHVNPAKALDGNANSKGYFNFAWAFGDGSHAHLNAAEHGGGHDHGDGGHGDGGHGDHAAESATMYTSAWAFAPDAMAIATDGRNNWALAAAPGAVANASGGSFVMDIAVVPAQDSLDGLLLAMTGHATSAPEESQGDITALLQG